MSDIRDDVRDTFAELYGAQPDGLWSAPGRVNLIGEHTDYNEGFVLPFAINRRTVLALGLRDDRRLRVGSAFADEVVEIALDELAPDALHGWSAYPLGVAWAFGQFGADLAGAPGVDIYLESTVPVGAGLSSSAAIESAVAVALNDVWQLGFDRQTLAKVGQLAENRAVGAPTGIMDQSASLLGRKDSAVFLDCRSLDSEVVPLGLAEDDLQLLIIDTGVSHDHATGGYADRRASCEKGARILGVESLRDVSVDDLPQARELLDDETFRRVRHVVTENQRVLDTVRTVREQGPTAIGPLLDASHVSMRDDFEISVPELDLAVETAQANGAIGARMTGGGFGGAAIALVSSEGVSRIQVAIDGAFAEHGFGQPTMFVVTASDGATRE
ncbi:MAG: galactokinase [Actinomycetota bacterium]|nr:galactokinase [Actinomycetota bacterium]